MTYCPECGSEVAPENTFCSYCGIALTPVAPFANSEPAPHEHTPVKESPKESDFFAPKPQPEAPKPAFDNYQVENKVENKYEHPEILPPTPAILENVKNDAGSFHEVVEPPTSSASKQETSQNWSPKTGSVDYPPASSHEPIDWTNNKPEPPVFDQYPAFDKKEPEFKEDDFFNNLQHENLEAKKQQAEAIPEQKGLVSPDSQTLDEFSGNEENYGFNKSSAPSVKNEPHDFQSTISYTPQDYISQELKAPQKVDKIEEPKIAEPQPLMSEPESSSKPENPGVISKPETPVGSSSYDSLAPTLISVQIFDPNEKPEDHLNAEHPVQKAESFEPPKSVEKVEPFVQPKSAPQIEVPASKSEVKESRSATSPIIGNSDTGGKSKTKLKSLDEGTVLNGRYEIVRKIGGGGMGAVYLASDRNLGGVLRAVKEMVQSYIEDAQQEKAINDFKRESLLLTTLEHQAIPTIYDYFFDEQEARFYLVMKYISGGDLSARLRSAPEGRLDEASVTDWAIQIADVLDYLHNRQPPIVYRDLKPSNVMIDGNNGRAMLIDFGIARWVNKEEKGVTAVGTMGYAPPELFSGNVEPRSDIYSLGSTMFHLLTGADPQSNPLLIFDFNKNPRPRQINSRLSDQIEKILMRMVEYSADRRFSSAAELRDDLTKHLESLRKGDVTFGAGDSAGIAKAAANELVFCGFCGQKIVATDIFCPFCGAQQPLAGQSGKVQLILLRN